jgi:hypothetical protein
MSEGSGEHPATDREERFGHIVFRTWRDDVYSLDLYETHETYAPGIACKGHCIPAIRQHGPDRFRRPVVPGSVPVGVELTADPDAFNEIYEMMGAGTFEREGGSRDDPGAPYSALFRLGGPWRYRSPYFSIELSAPVRSQEGTVWTGRVDSKGPTIMGGFEFLLEQYGKMEPVLLLLVVYLLVFRRGEGKLLGEDVPGSPTSHADPLYEFERCYKLALRLCGDKGNIKSLNSTTSLSTRPPI